MSGEVTDSPPPPLPGLAARGGPLVALAGAALVLVVVLGLREVADLVVPVIFGLFIALVVSPLIGRLQARGVGRPVALTLAVLVVLVIVALAIAVIAISVGDLVVRVPRYEDRLQEAITTLRELLAQLGVATETDAITSIVSPEQIVSAVRPIAAAVSSAGAALFIMAFTLIYALAGAGSLRARAEAAFGPDHPLIRGVQRFGIDLRRYLVVRAQLGAFAAVLTVILLFLLGVPFPVLWGLLVFAASFIPNVGFIVALIPPLILAFLEGGLVPAILVVAGFALINVLQDHLLQPIVMGSELNLSPLVVMLSVIAWAWILGAAGALLAVPMTVGLVAILEAFPESRGLASLMRNRLERAAEPAEAAAEEPS